MRFIIPLVLYGVRIQTDLDSFHFSFPLLILSMKIADISTKLAFLRKMLREKKLDAVLIRAQKNRFYLTGFDSSEGIFLITPKATCLFLDGRYIELAKKRMRNLLVRPFGPGFAEISTMLDQQKASRIGFEAAHIDNPVLTVLKKNLSTLKGSQKREFVPLAGFAEQSRLIKSRDEIVKIKKACALTDRIFEQMKEEITGGMTELDLQRLFRTLAARKGVLKLSFDPIIALNDGASYPHYMLTGSRKLQTGDVILFDIGVEYDGYQSDMTRVLFFGKPRPEWQIMYEQLLHIQRRTIKMIQPGRSIDETMREFEALYATRFPLKNLMHSLGHGVGLDVHELPFLSTKNRDIWQPNMIVTVEPGIYYPGKIGFRIEDTCLVTDKGAISLCKTPKSLKECVL